MKALRLVSASLLMVVAFVAPAAADGEKAKDAKNMTLLDDVAFEGGTELAAAGKTCMPDTSTVKTTAVRTPRRAAC